MASDYPGPTEPMLAAQLRMASEAVHAFLLQRLIERGFPDIRQSHFALFQFPGPHGVRAGDLARHVRLTKQALNPLLSDLERFGYLQRDVDPADHRGRILRLTNRGLRMASELKHVLVEIEQQLIDRVGQVRADDLRDILVEIVETFGGGARDPTQG